MPENKSQKKPNILIIMTDQQRADTIAALGNSIIKTPALDSLVQTGTAFTRAYTPAPICSPARISMVTGLPPHEHGFTDHDWFHWEPEEGPPSNAPHDSAFHETALDKGYHTFWSGKVHHSGRPWLFAGVQQYAGDGKEQISKKTEVLPSYSDYCEKQGFEPYYPPSAGIGSEYYMIPQATSVKPEQCRPNWLTDQCIDFLEKRDDDQPFLMHLHFVEPHPPVQNPFPWARLYHASEMEAPHRPDNYKDYQARTNRYQNRYKCRETGQEDDMGYRIFKAAYYGNISYVDFNIGRLLDALGDERDNTLIIFTCDHGDMLGDYGCVGKRCMMEGSIRIPMIVAWPNGGVPQDKQCQTPVTLLDVYPTIQDALGVDAEPRSEEGASMIQIAKDDKPVERIVFSQFSKGWCGQYAATDGQWKYAYSAPDDKEWLLRVSDELEEGPNLIHDPEAQPHKKRLKAALMERHDPENDFYSEAVKNGDWIRHTPPPEDYLDDPVFGILWQERAPQKAQEAVDALGKGYAKPVTRDQKQSLHGLHAVSGGVSPFEKQEE